jgi:hypothetical protein
MKRWIVMCALALVVWLVMAALIGLRFART